MSNIWKNFQEWSGLKKPDQELNRSHYSLVSCGEVTEDTLRLWVGLPEEVKYDPALAKFKECYEKEHGKVSATKSKSMQSKQRLPQVYSAPVLNKELQDITETTDVSDDIKVISNGDKIEEIDENGEDTLNDNIETIPTKFTRAKYATKMSLLLACWLFFTAIFLMYNEKQEIIRNTALLPGEIKNYTIFNLDSELSISVSLSGPFLSDNEEMKFNSTQIGRKRMEIWLERWRLKNTVADINENDVISKKSTEKWFVTLEDTKQLDFNEGESRTNIFSLRSNDSVRSHVFVLVMRSNTNDLVPFRLSYTENPLDVTTGVIYACFLLCGLYTLIIFEVMNRTMAAVIVSTLSIAALSVVGERPDLAEIISWLDVETLLLLFSMMVLVAIMAETGIFDFLAVFAFEVTKGKLWPLIFLLCMTTAILSTFLDNVTTVLLMSPVTIRLCEVMDLNPVPILMFMAMYSNIGGTATPVGDPPNVIVASNKAVIQAGINFTNFTAHMSLGIIFVGIQTSLQLRYMFRDSNKLRLSVPRDIQDLRQQISIWRRAADSLPNFSKDVDVVKERLDKKIKKLTIQLENMIKESQKRACPKDTFKRTLVELKEKYKIRDRILLAKASVAIVFVVTVFFLHALPELNRVSLSWTALLGAILLLILADREDLEPILHRVEWSTLLFFAALFVLMEALTKLGLIQFIGGLTESVILMVDEKARLAVALLLMLWVSGVTSAFVDNIPLTTMMVRVVTSLGSNPQLNLPMAPLIWSLAFGACLGGNGTLIGASANVVCAGVAEQHGYKFTFVQFFKIGFPLMIGHLIVISGYLLLCHCVFTWH